MLEPDGRITSHWFERCGDVVVAELGEITKTVVLYGAKGDDAAAVFYDGEPQGQRYRAPLCNTCNTRCWSGWDPQYGRAAPIRNLAAGAR